MPDLEPWMGHTPRDRGSIWYVVPVMNAGFLLLLAAFVAALVIGAQ